MIYLQLFVQFFKIGLFAFGGAYATIPFLYDISDRFGWFSHQDILNMLAVSQTLPGPIGINIATFAGLKVAGVAGALVASFALVAPSLILVGLAFEFLKKFSDHPVVNAVLWGLRPAASAMIAYALVVIGRAALFDLPRFHTTGQLLDIFKINAFVILAILVLINTKTKIHPSLNVVIAGVLGFILYASCLL